MRRRAAFAAAALACLASANPARAVDRPDWHGYTQVRYTYGRKVSSFAVRRAKLLVDGPAPGSEKLHFKLQGQFRSQVSGSFVLQDVYAEYRWRATSFPAGQMVLDFGLERQQPAYEIPLVERAGAINTLVPGASTMGRDIGVQATLAPNGARFSGGLGLFNGNGANPSANEDNHFLAVARLPTVSAMRLRLLHDVAGESGRNRLVDFIKTGILSPREVTR